MSMNDKERLECLIDHCNALIVSYSSTIEQHGHDYEKPMSYFEAWDDFVDALENIEEGMK